MDGGSDPAGAVVVGVDATAEAIGAAWWATDLARRWAAPVRLVHLAAAPGVPGWLRELAARTDARPEVLPAGASPDEPGVSSDAVADALAERSAGARLVVVGGHGTGPGSLQAGRVADRLAREAFCPVAVVRGPDGPDGAVVAGVTGVGDDEVVAGAAALASAWAAPLHLVHAWSDVVAGPGRPVRPPDASATWARARAVLEDARAAAVAVAPGVRVRTSLVEGTALRALLDAARGARALVVGPYGAEPPETGGLGSTSCGLVGFAACPVLVTRATHPAAAL